MDKNCAGFLFEFKTSRLMHTLRIRQSGQRRIRTKRQARLFIFFRGPYPFFCDLRAQGFI